MKVDKSAINKDEQVVYDDSLKGKNIDAIDKRPGLDFKDQGIAKIPVSAKNMFCKGSRSKESLLKYYKGYEGMSWNCKDCNKEECNCVCSKM